GRPGARDPTGKRVRAAGTRASRRARARVLLHRAVLPAEPVEWISLVHARRDRRRGFRNPRAGCRALGLGRPHRHLSHRVARLFGSQSPLPLPPDVCRSREAGRRTLPIGAVVRYTETMDLVELAVSEGNVAQLGRHPWEWARLEVV